jgi:transposase
MMVAPSSHRLQPDWTSATSTPTSASSTNTHSGEVIEEGRLPTSPEALRRRFSSEQYSLRIAIEAGTHSPWVSRVLEEECGHEVLVANPRKVRLIYINKRKSDETDAENLGTPRTS